MDIECIFLNDPNQYAEHCEATIWKNKFTREILTLMGLAFFRIACTNILVFIFCHTRSEVSGLIFQTP